jgi:hypothetical protein
LLGSLTLLEFGIELRILRVNDIGKESKKLLIKIFIILLLVFLLGFWVGDE